MRAGFWPLQIHSRGLKFVLVILLVRGHVRFRHKFQWKSQLKFVSQSKKSVGGQPFVLSLDSSTFRSPRGGKENERWSNPRKKLIENGKKEISFPPRGESQSAQTCFGGAVEKMSKFQISSGHNWGAIWSYRALSTTPGIARTSSCSGEGSQGAWGLGRWEKVAKCFIFGPLFFFSTFLASTNRF